MKIFRQIWSAAKTGFPSRLANDASQISMECRFIVRRRLCFGRGCQAFWSLRLNRSATSSFWRSSVGSHSGCLYSFDNVHNLSDEQHCNRQHFDPGGQRTRTCLHFFVLHFNPEVYPKVFTARSIFCLSKIFRKNWSEKSQVWMSRGFTDLNLLIDICCCSLM